MQWGFCQSSVGVSLIFSRINETVGSEMTSSSALTNFSSTGDGNMAYLLMFSPAQFFDLSLD